MMCLLDAYQGFESYWKQKLDIKVEKGRGMDPLSPEFQTVRGFEDFSVRKKEYCVLQLAY